MLILLETMAEERRTATAPELLEPLMARLAGGDQEALAELYHRTRTSVYGLALSYLKNQHDAEDVTQDAFVRAWENAHQYRPQGTPLAWLLTIARNLALMKLRERGRTQDMALEDWERLAAENPMVTVEDRQVLDAALTALLARDDAPTALCFHQDSLAIPLFFRLRQCGMAIPTDLSVTGFDNSTFSGEVGLTTVRQKPYDMAVAAARKALDLIEGRTLDQPHEIFPVQLLVRDSTAAPRVRG